MPCGKAAGRPNGFLGCDWCSCYSQEFPPQSPLVKVTAFIILQTVCIVCVPEQEGTQWPLDARLLLSGNARRKVEEDKTPCCFQWQLLWCLGIRFATLSQVAHLPPQFYICPLSCRFPHYSTLCLAILFWPLGSYPGGLWTSASWRGTVCCSYHLYLSPTNVGLWSRHKSSTPGYKKHSVLEWPLMGVHMSQQSWQYLLLPVTNRLGVLLSTSSAPHGWCSEALVTEIFLTFLKQNKCLQMLLETSMGMLGTKTLLPQSRWNFWKPLKSSINYCFLWHCWKLRGKHQEGSVSMNMGQSWLNCSSYGNVPVRVTGLVFSQGSRIPLPGDTDVACCKLPSEGQVLTFALCEKMHCVFLSIFAFMLWVVLESLQISW